MASLILTNPKDKTKAVSKHMISIDNWRALGTYSETILYLIAADFSSYHIYNLSFQKFLETVRLGFDLPVSGVYATEALSCSKCLGYGTTDWVSRVVGRHPSNSRNSSFTVDYNFPKYTLQIPLKNSPNFTLYINRAHVGEHLEHCPACGGTGLFMLSAKLVDTPIDKIPTYKF